MSDRCPYCKAKIVKTHPITKNNYECGSCGNEDYTAQSRECRNRQIANLQEKLDKTEQLLHYWQTRCLRAEASRDRWREYAMSLKRQQYQELITEDMIAEECKAIATLKEAGEWEE